MNHHSKTKIFLATVTLLLATPAYLAEPIGHKTLTQQLTTRPSHQSRETRSLRVERAPVESAQISLSIQFKLNSHEVLDESMEQIRQLAIAMNSDELQNARFRIEGHTDAKGNAQYNQRLSRLRANSVREELRLYGVETNRLEVVGKGSSEPLDKKHPHDEKNRRVTIVTLPL